jgi:3-isopropylmalate dehydrogenase
VTVRLAVIPGDGVGPEVTAAARTVLDAAGAAFGFDVAWTELTVGGAAIDAFGVPIRDEDLDTCRSSDAVLLGAVGGPRWDDPAAAVRPEQALFALRGGLGLFANLRPVSVSPALVPSSPLRPEVLDGVDLLIVRELTSGLYFGRPSEERATSGGRVAVDTLWYTEQEIARVVHLAFELARTRRRRVTQVDKANVLATSRLWRRVVSELQAAEYEDIRLSHELVDSFAMNLATHAQRYDVILTENLFGDILSDLAAAVGGGLGLAPSASLAAQPPGIFEPVHGSAPDIAGQGEANPIAMILSVAMMFTYGLGRRDVGRAITAAVDSVRADGVATADQVSGGRAYATWEVGQAVCDALAHHSSGGAEFADHPYAEAGARG